ncbi:hypothetical protein LshimejAT787_1104530 [Lyophyllum shimeji]|uniref:Uncharacterized protein n=1 Tax=Lyophyllum shimeji TaxID=47721 RepID=A0A9P3PVN9_LYOSH|nr:hypothetical protein LshimejAT787_1104530 [Lyophyllum shimeji]
MSSINFTWPEQTPTAAHGRQSITPVHCAIFIVNTDKWYPQGITTSADALDTGIYENKKRSYCFWRRTLPNALLVEPYTDSSGNPNFKSVQVHCGSLMWYGNLLYLVDTNNGIRVFDLDHIYKVSIGGNIGRQSAKVYEAVSYAYVVPQCRNYKASTVSPP